MQFPAFEHAQWLAEAWADGAPAHNLGASGFLPDEPLAGLPETVDDGDLMRIGLHQDATLQAALAQHLRLEPGQVRTTAGTTAANTAAVLTLLGPGEHVVCERPTYMPLPHLAQGIGAEVTWVDAPAGGGEDGTAHAGGRGDDGGARPDGPGDDGGHADGRGDDVEARPAIDIDAWTAACTKGTRLLLLTSPNNPMGHAASAQDLRALGDLAADCDAWLLVDQVYRDLMGHALGAACHDKVISTGGFNKCWGAPGLRVGWVAGPEEALDDIEEAHRLLSLGPPSFGTRMAQALLAGKQARRQALRDRLAQTHPIYERWCQTAGLPAAHGDLVAFPRIGGDTLALARGLRKQGILTVPGELFARPGHLRIGLGIAPDALHEGLDALAAALERQPAQRL